jgi:CubicO group peptidase (beta-lactamase class C family)
VARIKCLELLGVDASKKPRAWTRDTVSMVFSATKGASAICAHMAADRGQLDLGAPVRRYWPTFGKAGKEEAIVSAFRTFAPRSSRAASTTMSTWSRTVIAVANSRMPDELRLHDESDGVRHFDERSRPAPD